MLRRNRARVAGALIAVAPMLGGCGLIDLANEVANQLAAGLRSAADLAKEAPKEVGGAGAAMNAAFAAIESAFAAADGPIGEAQRAASGVHPETAAKLGAKLARKLAAQAASGELQDTRDCGLGGSRSADIQYGEADDGTLTVDATMTFNQCVEDVTRDFAGGGGSGGVVGGGGGDYCQWAGDGVCDEPYDSHGGEGTGACAFGTDPIDCGSTPTGRPYVSYIQPGYVTPGVTVTLWGDGFGQPDPNQPYSKYLFIWSDQGDHVYVYPSGPQIIPDDYTVAADFWGNDHITFNIGNKLTPDRDYWVDIATGYDYAGYAFSFHVHGAGGGNDSCSTARNGVCDEPNLCAPGTDFTDCSSAPTDPCPWANDGFCDVPTYCTSGDYVDCGTAPMSPLATASGPDGGPLRFTQTRDGSLKVHVVVTRDGDMPSEMQVDSEGFSDEVVASDGVVHRSDNQSLSIAFQADGSDGDHITLHVSAEGTIDHRDTTVEQHAEFTGFTMDLNLTGSEQQDAPPAVAMDVNGTVKVKIGPAQGDPCVDGAYTFETVESLDMGEDGPNGCPQGGRMRVNDVEYAFNNGEIKITQTVGGDTSSTTTSCQEVGSAMDMCMPKHDCPEGTTPQDDTCVPNQ